MFGRSGIVHLDTHCFKLVGDSGFRSVVAGNLVSSKVADVCEGVHTDAADSVKEYFLFIFLTQSEKLSVFDNAI